MSFVSLHFIAFLAGFFLLFFVVPRKIKWLVVLIASLVFLFYNNLTVEMVVYVLLVLLSAYGGALLIDKCKYKKTACFVSVTLILGLLIYLKYTNLLLVTCNNIFGTSFEMVYRNAPIGISYFSLIMIGYVIDVYRGLLKPQRNILKCSLFMTYFPLLTSGPFIRSNYIEKDLFEYPKFDFKRICYGLIRMLWGAFKILVLSQRLGIFVDTVYGDLSTYNGFFVIIAAMFYTLQLYTNFSGSIDIIMGISEIIGVKLPENFNTPFFSPTITEFWRRWHITLGEWLKDYIFYPLLKSNFIQGLTKYTKKLFGKKVGKKIPLYLSMLILWITIGIWHGGAYTYIVASGLLQFVFIVLEDMLSPVILSFNNKIGINTNAFSYKLYQCIRTFLLFSFAMIFFRATSMENAFEIIKSVWHFNPWILLNNTSLYTAGLDMLDFRLLMGAIVVLFVVEFLQRSGSVRDKLYNQNIVFRWIIIFVLIFSIILFGCYGPGYDTTTFIYRQF